VIREMGEPVMAARSRAPGAGPAAASAVGPVFAMVFPAIGDRLLKESVSQAFAVGHNTDVPLIIGSNIYETSLLETLKIPPAAILAVAPAVAEALPPRGRCFPAARTRG
jgi:para-nitrobenzyl esterase